MSYCLLRWASGISLTALQILSLLAFPLEIRINSKEKQSCHHCTNLAQDNSIRSQSCRMADILGISLKFCHFVKLPSSHVHLGGPV